jgi:hypothetical protein
MINVLNNLQKHKLMPRTSSFNGLVHLNQCSSEVIKNQTKILNKNIKNSTPMNGKNIFFNTLHQKETKPQTNMPL